MRYNAPELGNDIFFGVNADKKVIVKVRQGFLNGYDLEWQNKFKGGNTFIKLTIVEE